MKSLKSVLPCLFSLEIITELDLLPKTSGFPRARDLLLAHIAEKQPKELDRATTSAMLEVSISTAGNYLMTLASEFPENLSYIRGILVIKSSFPEARLPPEVRLRTKTEKIAQIKETLRKINSNHLRHKDLKEIRKKLKQIQQEVERI